MQGPAMRRSGLTAQRAIPVHYEEVHGCAHEFLASFAFPNWSTANPPYLHASRRSNRRYRYKWMPDQATLLALLRSLACDGLGSPSALYDEMLRTAPRSPGHDPVPGPHRGGLVHLRPEPMRASHAAQRRSSVSAKRKAALGTGLGPCRRVNVSRLLSAIGRLKPSDGADQLTLRCASAPPLPPSSRPSSHGEASWTPSR